MSHILIVDDDPGIRRLLQRWIEADGGTAVLAESAEQGLLLASQYPPAVALCDIRLPRGQDGFWLVEQLRRVRPETVVVMSSGIHEFDAAVTSLRAGAIDYIVKPFTQEAVRLALARALDEHRLRQKASALWSLRATGGAGFSRAAALLAVLQAEDGHAARRAERVARLAVTLAQALAITEPELSDIEHAALLRDVARMDVHAMAPTVPYLSAASAIALAVQERVDGSGFPQGLRGDAIPRGARVVAVAEAYDELSRGDGHTPVLPAHAVEILCGRRAAGFDPTVLQALSSLRLESQSPDAPSVPA